MKDLLAVTLVMAAALGVAGMAIGVGHDSATFVSPPEAVAEQFTRKLAGGRYDVARQHLEQDSPVLRDQIRATSDALRARAGAISAVDGQPGHIEGDRATASALLKTEKAGEIVLEFMMVRHAGAWRITGWKELP